MAVPSIDFEAVNRQLRDASPFDIVRWAVQQQCRLLATTSFGRNASVLLDVIDKVDTSIPVVWIDTGYNLRDTYVVAEKIIASLSLSVDVFAPLITSERRNAIMGGIPTIEEAELHSAFTEQVKLEPFRRALEKYQPEIWLTGIRKEETAHRQNLDIVSMDGRGILKVAPLFYWTEEQMENYVEAHNLLTCRHYFDPTKVSDGRECGLHTSA
jgi:phosphoadenosine phosphosulfate reductase